MGAGGPLLRTALSGLLLAGALPHLDWGWLAWVGLAPFLALFPFRSKRAAFGHGFLLGVCYLGGMAYWVAVFAAPILGPALGVLGWALVTAYQAFYLAVWALGAQWLAGRGVWAWRLGVPALWAVVEWWRQSGDLGFGWGDLAYTQHLALPVLQLTKLSGIWGLAFLIVLVNVALAEVVKAPPPQFWGKAPPPQFWGAIWIRRAQQAAPLRVLFRLPRIGAGGQFPLAVAALLVTVLACGGVSLRTEHLAPTFTAAALQGNISQNVEQDAAYKARVTATFGAQTRSAAARGATLVVWPETAYPGYLQRADTSRAQVAGVLGETGQTALIGGVDFDPAERKNANALFALSPSGAVTGVYRKQHLVPFGEFVPGRKWLPFLAALHVTNFDMAAGTGEQGLLGGGPGIGKIGAAICFESSYPRVLREQVRQGAGLLAISTDDAWFGRTAAARQHAAIAAVRAAETDRYLVRSAATGVSQIVDPTGRVLAEADLFQASVVSAPVQSRSTVTPYVRWGDWFIGVCVVLILAVSARARRAGTARSSGR